MESPSSYSHSIQKVIENFPTDVDDGILVALLLLKKQGVHRKAKRA
jgi:hypothetical protein